MMTMMMTAATRPRSNDGDDEDIERNSTITTIRQDHDNTKINDSHCEEVDGGCEYGDEGFESDGAMSAGRGADGRGGDGSDGGDGRAGDAVDGHHVAEGGGGFLANTTSRDDGDFFQLDDDSDGMSEVPSKFMQKSDSKGSDNDSRHRRRENEGGGEDNHITRSEGHSPMRLSVDDNDGEQYAQSRPDSDPEEGAVADGDYSPLPGRPSFGGNDGGDNTGTRENADDNKTAASANPRPSSDSARFSQKIKSLGRGAGSAVNNATAGILSPATAAPEGFEVVRGDRCATRGEDSRGAGIGRCERRQSQETTAEDRCGSKRSSVDLGQASNLKRERQERMIQQLAHDNDVLKRKVAGFQLALQLSADEGGFCTSPSFSAAFPVAPPAFPRDGGTPAPSPRVTRGWTRQTPPARRVPSTIERDLSYTSLVRQLGTGERRTRTLRRANEALGARVNELESGAILRATQARLAERDEDIAALREELSVMQRLARAQDRKFEGSSGYAMARRLWAAEEELRLARSTASALGAEVIRFRNARKPRRRQVQNRVPGDPQNTDTSAAEPRRCSARQKQRPVARRKSGADKKHQGSGGIAHGGDGDGGRDVRRGGEGDSWVEDKEPAGQGERGVRSDRSGANVASSGSAIVCGGGEGFNNKKGAMEVKADLLQRALENMRSKAKGELRTAHFEIDGLKQENAGLAQALTTKAKEMRLQVLQVSRLKRELRGLSAGAAKLEEATFTFTLAANNHANSRATTRAIASAAGGAPSMAVGADALGAERRLVKSAAATVTATTSGCRGVPLHSLSSVRRWNPRPADSLDDRRQRVPTRLVSGLPVMRWNQDWDEEGDGAVGIKKRTRPSRKAVADGKLSVAAAGGRDVEQGSSSTGGGGGGGDESEDGGSGATKRAMRKEKSRPEMEEETLAQRKKTGSLPIKRASRFPCPLSGIIDMSEPALHQRRSVYPEDRNDTASLPENGTVQMDAETPRGDEEAIGCFIDSDGFVRHSKQCVMSEVVEDRSSTKRFTREMDLRGDGGGQLDSGPEPRPLLTSTALAAPLSVTSPGHSPRLSTVSPGSSPGGSSVFESGEGRLKQTIQTVRRPIQLSVESVPETTA